MSQSIPDQFFEKLKKQQQSESDHRQFTAWFNTATEAEIEEVLAKYSWYFQNEPDELYPENEHLANLIENKIDEAEKSPPLNVSSSKQTKLWPFVKKVTAAAAMLSALGLFYYFLKERKQPRFAAEVTQTPQILPGGNKATLTLGNGKIITLDSAHNGMLANQSGVHIYKSKNGQLVYDVSKYNAHENDVTYNTISTPRGGQYQVVLPDGSKVWLNAESSLKFPAHFSGPKRIVTLDGEAYFEVAKDKAHPFKVNVNDIDVEVLGTHFNIMAYKNEEVAKTTLLEGSVKISKGKVVQTIVPGQQATVKQEDITIKNVDVNEAVEWKNGNFNFAHEKLPNIMRKIARWYDVDINYEGKTTAATFIGTIPRSQSITEVLKYLELTGLVHFEITERRITVMP